MLESRSASYGQASPYLPIIDLLQATPPDERAQIRGLNSGRADIMLAGVVVAGEVMSRIEARDLVVSSYGIREGILLERAKVRATPADPGAARERSVQAAAAKSPHPSVPALRKTAVIGRRTRTER